MTDNHTEELELDAAADTPRPRSLPVVVLDTLVGWVTVARRPFQTTGVTIYQQVAIAIAAGIVLIGAVVLLVGVKWTPTSPAGTPHRAAAGGVPAADRHTAGGTPQPSGSASTPGVVASDGSTRPYPSGTGTGGTTPSGTSGPGRTGPDARAEPLEARFAKVDGSQSLANYRATVTVTNPGQVGASRWTVVLTLPRETVTLSDVVGATASRNGAAWTLVPTAATASVSGGGTVSVSFRVNGAAVFDATPTGCTIDGKACSGLPG